ncbi:hypothetical protein CEE35_01430 [Candidatus Aerophobetes bacterium Ae_b3b]|nr:MAG: hypothetical protein CEE35_01430 [Candidatus Aerophobetes bacterium Ae_b3b]
MSLQIRLMAILASCVMLIIVVDLIRREKLRAQYSLFWLLVGFIFLIFSLWTNLLNLVARIIGIYTLPNALFFIGFVGTVVILLHFSVIISTLSIENKKLVERLSILSWRVEELEKGTKPRGKRKNKSNS